MILDPREAHALEQLQAKLREVARVCASYRKELEERGYPPAEAWASAKELEGRFADRLLDEWEKPAEVRALERVMESLEREMDRRGGYGRPDR